MMATVAAEPTTAATFTSFRCLTFDVFGTLVDWESGIYDALEPLLAQLPAGHPLCNDRHAVLRAFVAQEGIAQSTSPEANYQEILAAAYRNLADELQLPGKPSDQEAQTFGGCVGRWKPFPDTIEALQRLKKKGFKLVVLSNVDKASFAKTLSDQLVGVDFDAIYTAEEIGSYKPDLRNFKYLLEHCENDLGVTRKEIIHTAQSLHHDQEPACKMGMTSAWIDRAGGCMGGTIEEYGSRTKLTWRFKTMGEMADAVDKELK